MLRLSIRRNHIKRVRGDSSCKLKSIMLPKTTKKRLLKSEELY